MFWWILIGAALLLSGKERRFRIILRALVGALAIFTLNAALEIRGLPAYVAINEMTLGVCGILGLPGFLGLYGLRLYAFFY
ncbi:MAG: pro-sigmaK processing inhibitor BofA family protein [Lachnospiraceae bacterium]|nr:pro-sigmaK processing inhibitor BofA family protein [Lachnospiraceae bacterium]